MTWGDGNGKVGVLLLWCRGGLASLKRRTGAPGFPRRSLNQRGSEGCSR